MYRLVYQLPYMTAIYIDTAPHYAGAYTLMGMQCPCANAIWLYIRLNISIVYMGPLINCITLFIVPWRGLRPNDLDKAPSYWLGGEWHRGWECTGCYVWIVPLQTAGIFTGPGTGNTDRARALEGCVAISLGYPTRSVQIHIGEPAPVDVVGWRVRGVSLQ